MNTVAMRVTPDMATKWLEENNSQNRTVSQDHVDFLASEMREGRWELTHQGIAFDEKGNLIDGQHRLWAVVTSGVTADMLVTFGAPRRTILVVDIGDKPRTGIDNRRIAGVAGPANHGEEATLRNLLDGPIVARRRISARKIAEMFAPHADAIRFAHEVLPTRKGIASGLTRSIIARAYYSQDHDKLRTFGAMLASGITTGQPEDQSVVILRETIRNAKDKSASGKLLLYGKTERGLAAYLRGEVLQKLYAAQSELFPIPSESPTADMQTALN